MKLKIVTLYHCPACDEGHTIRSDAIYCCTDHIKTSDAVMCPECGELSDVPLPGERFTCATCQTSDSVDGHPHAVRFCPECMDRGREVPLRTFYAPFSPTKFFLACPNCCWIESEAIEPAVMELHAPDRQYKKAQEYARVHP